MEAVGIIKINRLIRILNRRKDSCMERQRFLILGNRIIAQCDILLLGQS